jgi:zinc-ribbon domain
VSAAQPQPISREELLRRRDALAREFAELQYGLGGLAYEMAVRDHWRVDVLVRYAAQLQEIDAQLASVERLGRLDGGAEGACPSCGAPYGRGAAFCSQCGTELIPQAAV